MNNYANSRWKERGSFDKSILHSYQDIVDAIRTAPYGIDTREAMAQMLIFLYSATQSVSNNLDLDMSPTDAFGTLDELKKKYPNGQNGIYVVQETGRWYFWSELEHVWKDGGFYQAPVEIKEIKDGRVWAKGISSKTIGDAIRGQLNQENMERQVNDNSLKSELDYYKTLLDQVYTAFVLKTVNIKDKKGNLLWNGDKLITGKAFLPRTDTIGGEQGVPIDSGIVGDTFLGKIKEYGLPILKISGKDIGSLNTKNDGKIKNLNCSYIDKNLTRNVILKSIKVQGSSSQAYPKKNYTLEFDENIIFKEKWGTHKKYVIKADWVDFSHMRNEFGANLWKRIRETRIKNSDNLVDKNGDFLIDKNNNILSGETNSAFLGPALGAIDSFPILVFINEKYHGLYSFTIPKSDWMAGMGSGKKEAILSAETHSSATQFRDHVIDKNGILDDKDFSVEYASDENWIVNSLNTMIDSVAKDSMDEFIDSDSAIDYLLFNTLLGNGDGIDKNFLLNTWDGKKWFFNAYDMDSSFGNFWDGTKIIPTDAYMFDIHRNKSKLWECLIDNKKDKLKERWFFLRKNILKKDNLISDVYNYASSTPDAVFDYEKRRWPNRPNTRTNTPSQIAEWLEKRLDKIDNYLQ